MKTSKNKKFMKELMPNVNVKARKNKCIYRIMTKLKSDIWINPTSLLVSIDINLINPKFTN